MGQATDAIPQYDAADVGHARARAQMLWQQPTICNRIVDYLPDISIVRFMCVDRATLHVLISKVYRTCTLEGYLNIAKDGWIPHVGSHFRCRDQATAGR